MSLMRKNRFKKAKLPPIQHDYIPFVGGLDTETPRWDVPVGRLRDSENYEMNIEGGISDIGGYERFDGQPKPSAGLYHILDVTVSGTFAAGDTITGATSTATAVVLEVVTGGAQAYLVITKIAVAVFQDAEDLTVSAVVQGNTDSLAKANGASTLKLNARYLNLSADEYRSDIGAIPGSGDVLGLIMLDDITYGFRNNAGATATDLYKESASGWTQVSLNNEISFTAGTAAFVEGETLTGGTSGATATILRIVLESGSFAGNDAAGRLIIGTVTSSPYQAETGTSASGSATLSGAESAITIAASGSYEFDVANFGGQLGTLRIYGVNGVDKGFEFDGTVYVPISTGTTVDKPTHVIVHKNHLFFSFAGSMQHSGISTPYIWTLVFGAAELATGDTISGFMVEPGELAGATLGCYNRNTIHMLYGSSAADWNLVRYRDEIGAFEDSIQQFGRTIFLDDRGLTDFKTVLDYGNFRDATLSSHIQSFINEKKTLVTASCIARDKNQYRVFFNDGTGLYVTSKDKDVIGMTPVSFPDTVRQMYSLELSSGAEQIMFGSADGFVYELEKGTSFDGDNITGQFSLHYHHSKTPRNNKVYKGLTLEAEGSGYSEFIFDYSLGYGSTDIEQPASTVNVLGFTVPKWDAGGSYDSALNWDGSTLSPTTHFLEGEAENISIMISKDSDEFKPIKYSGALIRLIMRRVIR